MHRIFNNPYKTAKHKFIMLTSFCNKALAMVQFHLLLPKPQLQLIQRRWKVHRVAFQQTCDLHQAVSEAEKIVGYPTSFLNLRWLLTDELANVALHFRKLIGTNHPVLETARKLFVGNAMPAWGLTVLLISKAGGLNSRFPENETDVTAGVLHSQRALAEVTEIIRTSNLIHKSILNVDEKTKNEFLDVNFGNKIALLTGDYLLSKSFHELACIRNPKLNELMSSALRDLAEVEFIGPRDNQNMPLPSRPQNVQINITVPDHFDTKPYKISNILGNPLAEWTLQNILGGASLLGKSCQGTLKLARHSEEVQRLGYLFGKNAALAWQAKLEQEAFAPTSRGMFSLVSAPVMLHLQEDPSLYEKIERGKNNVEDVDYEDLRKVIQKGVALKKTRDLQKELLSNALDVLYKLPSSDARTALKNILNAML